MRRCRTPLRLLPAFAVITSTMAFATASHVAAQTAAQSKAQLAPAPTPWSETIARKYFPITAEQPPIERIARLTRDQLDATVKALLPSYFGASVKTVMARDPLQTNYEYAELLSINIANFGALTGWIGDIAERVRRKPAGVVDCNGGKTGNGCLDTEARKFVRRAFRGDANDDRLKQVADFYIARVRDAGYAQATGDLVEVVLNSPSFLYRTEIAGESDRAVADARRLQALSYTLADAPPEALKLDAAQARTYFSSGQSAATTLDRIVASPEAKAKLKRFFSAWLEIKEPAEFTISPNYYAEFNPKLATAMLSETDAFLSAKLAEPAPKLKDITQETAMPLPRDLAPIYEAPDADPIAAKLAEYGAPRRMGIFSLPAVLASHSGPTGTRPIKRGVFWGKKVLCMPMRAPEVGTVQSEITDIPHATERQRITASTKDPKCIGCHAIIDPLGFFQERYDAIGKWRTEDNGQPVDASMVIDFLGEGPPVTTHTPVDAIKRLTSSSMFKQCFVRQLFRFYMGRNEDPADDPVLKQMYLRFTNTDQDLLKTLYVLSASDRLLLPQ